MADIFAGRGFSQEDESCGPEQPGPPRVAFGAGRAVAPLGMGIAVLLMSIIVLIPLAALTAGAFDERLEPVLGGDHQRPGPGTGPADPVVSADRDRHQRRNGGPDHLSIHARPLPGQGLVDSLIDLPFALPTIVAGLTLLASSGRAGRRAST